MHKISFIAQDMTDNRAFGYIYGSPENGHRFFGIKTEKAAGQVVVAMRDLFQVVFELKKKEIDEAKQNIDAGENESVRRGVDKSSKSSIWTFFLSAKHKYHTKGSNTFLDFTFKIIKWAEDVAECKRIVFCLKYLHV